jgi:hypothetical protein
MNRLRWTLARFPQAMTVFIALGFFFLGVAWLWHGPASPLVVLPLLQGIGFLFLAVKFEDDE